VLWLWTDQGLQRSLGSGLRRPETWMRGLIPRYLRRESLRDKLNLRRICRRRIHDGGRSSLMFLRGRGVAREEPTESRKRAARSKIQAVLPIARALCGLHQRRLVRWNVGKLERLPVTIAGLGLCLTLMEDREGNIWPGPSGRLHILRDQRFRTLGRGGTEFRRDYNGGRGRRRTLWIGTPGRAECGEARRPETDGSGSGRPVKNLTVRNGLLSDVILSLAARETGALGGNSDGLNRIRATRLTRLPRPTDCGRLHPLVAGGRRRTLWIGTRRGLAHWATAPEGRPRRTSRPIRRPAAWQRPGWAMRGYGWRLWCDVCRLSAAQWEDRELYDGQRPLQQRGDGLLPAPGVGADWHADHGWNLWTGIASPR